MSHGELRECSPRRRKAPSRTLAVPVVVILACTVLAVIVCVLGTSFLAALR